MVFGIKRHRAAPWPKPRACIQESVKLKYDFRIRNINTPSLSAMYSPPEVSVFLCSCNRPWEPVEKLETSYLRFPRYNIQKLDLTFSSRNRTMQPTRTREILRTWARQWRKLFRNWIARLLVYLDNSQ